VTDPSFPAWLRLTHFLTILFIGLLIRSGIEILGHHPKLYWDDACRPGTEWLRFTRKRLPADRLWTSQDEEERVSPLIGLPGRSNLGLGRYWHFAATAGWIATGLAYVLLLVGTGEWRRIVPTSLDAFPAAWDVALTYARLQIPPEGHLYNALQQLTYFAVVFLLAPLAIATGAAMSPAIGAAWPAYPRLFGGRQAARSLHFLVLLAFVAFTVVHTFLVAVEGPVRKIGEIGLGTAEIDAATAAVVALGAAAAIVAVHVLATAGSLAAPERTRGSLAWIVDPLERVLFRGLRSRQDVPARDVPSFFRVNGRPPGEPTYTGMRASGFRDWRLVIEGLVERPLSLSLDDLRRLPRATQRTTHSCIQGWTAIGEWTGVSVAEILERCRPRAGARYAVFHSLQQPPEGHGPYYEVIDLELARRPQTILAYEMNGVPLPPEHGAPLRLRVETQLGFKMVKFLRSIEIVADYRSVRGGHGGWREDVQHYARGAGI
jgi:DMSO/TMAO reductase YedYZ molybdopterin-dependent catalytic subunit/thiosulfate reductase cytochrome b subunit